MSGGSFESNNDMRLHFGLGTTERVDKVEIRWSDGQKETVALPGIDRYYAIEEGKGLVPSVYDTITPGIPATKSGNMRAAAAAK